MISHFLKSQVLDNRELPMNVTTDSIVSIATFQEKNLKFHKGVMNARNPWSNNQDHFERRRGQVFRQHPLGLSKGQGPEKTLV